MRFFPNFFVWFIVTNRFLYSSVLAERAAVNRKVVGSNPAGGALYIKLNIHIVFDVIFYC